VRTLRRFASSGGDFGWQRSLFDVSKRPAGFALVGRFLFLFLFKVRFAYAFAWHGFDLLTTNENAGLDRDFEYDRHDDRDGLSSRIVTRSARIFARCGNIFARGARGRSRGFSTPGKVFDLFEAARRGGRGATCGRFVRSPGENITEGIGNQRLKPLATTVGPPGRGVRFIKYPTNAAIGPPWARWYTGDVCGNA